MCWYFANCIFQEQEQVEEKALDKKAWTKIYIARSWWPCGSLFVDRVYDFLGIKELATDQLSLVQNKPMRRHSDFNLKQN